MLWERSEVSSARRPAAHADSPRVAEDECAATPTGRGLNGYEIREYRPGDERAILSSFERVFRGEPAARRTLAEWRWEFLANPGGWRIFLALLGDQVVAQSAGIAQRARVDGRAAHFSLTVDSMVLPEHRAGLKHPGLFVRTVEAYIRAYGGARDLVFYGWPNRVAQRIGRAQLGYEVVRNEAFVVRELDPVASPGPSEVTAVDPGEPLVDALWERCARDWPVALVHDARFLDWRFGMHPSRSYECWGVRARDGQLRALAVTRRLDWPIPGTTVIAEWLVPTSEPGAGALLREAIEARAAASGGHLVLAMFPPWSPWNGRFAAAGYQIRPSDLALTVRIHDPELELEALREGWWLQLSDSDLV